jgi:hypothetical protein
LLHEPERRRRGRGGVHPQSGGIEAKHRLAEVSEQHDGVAGPDGEPERAVALEDLGRVGSSLGTQHARPLVDRDRPRAQVRASRRRGGEKHDDDDDDRRHAPDAPPADVP